LKILPSKATDGAMEAKVRGESLSYRE